MIWLLIAAIYVCWLYLILCRWDWIDRPLPTRRRPW